MTPVIWINLLWSGFVFSVASVLWLIFWRKKQQRHQEFERLLEDVDDRQSNRPASLTRRLEEKFQLDTPTAQKLTGALIAAEKQFLQQFIEQQLQQKSVENIYLQLCELLDSYLLNMPNLGNGGDTPKQSAKPQQNLDDEPGDTQGQADEVGLPDDTWVIEDS